jgi:hypothetical protein
MKRVQITFELFAQSPVALSDFSPLFRILLRVVRKRPPGWAISHFDVGVRHIAGECGVDAVTVWIVCRLFGCVASVPYPLLQILYSCLQSNQLENEGYRVKIFYMTISHAIEVSALYSLIRSCIRNYRCSTAEARKLNVAAVMPILTYGHLGMAKVVLVNTERL